VRRLAPALVLAAAACGAPPAPPPPPAPTPAAPVAAETAAAGGGLYLTEAPTARGILEPVRVERAPGTTCVELRLDGKPVGEDCEAASAHVQAVHPAGGEARLALIGLGTGGNACPEFYRVVEVPADGAVRVSERFGNCAELASTTWTDAGWRIEIPAYEGGSFLHPRAPGQSWLYRDGALVAAPVR
jgi:hypothetical protein